MALYKVKLLYIKASTPPARRLGLGFSAPLSLRSVSFLISLKMAPKQFSFDIDLAVCVSEIVFRNGTEATKHGTVGGDQQRPRRH